MVGGRRGRGAGLVAVVVAVVVVVGALVAGCSPGPGGTYDGSCAAGPAYRSVVTARAAGTGTARWTRTLPHPRDDRPQVSGGLVLLRGCGVLVLDTDDGSRRLRRDDETGLLGLAGAHVVSQVEDGLVAEPVDGRGGLTAGSAPPYLDTGIAGDLALAAADGSLVAFDLRGAPRHDEWRTTLPGLGAHNDYLAAGGQLVVRSDDGSLYRLDATTGEVRWRVLPPAPDLGWEQVLAVDATTVVVATGVETATGSVTATALDLADGSPRWRRAFTAAPPSAPASPWPVAEGVMAVPTARGVLGVDLRSGRARWRLPAAAQRPVATTSALVLDDETSAVAVEPRSGAVLWRRATTHRPLLGADPASDQVVVLDSPEVPYGFDDCC